MANHAEELGKLAEAIDEAKRELNLAREQSTKPKHLWIRARRAAVQAARAVAAAVDLGFSEIWPQGWWVLSAMREPDDPDRPPATIQIGDWKAELRSMKLGSGCNPDGTLRDDTAFAVWIQQICPVMRSRQTTAKADAGAFDFPEVKKDAQGRILGRDGKPLPLIQKTDPETGWVEESLQGPEARVTDDYDEADALEHLRCQVADWVDACNVAADLMRNAAQGASDAAQGADTIIEAGNSAQGDDEAEATKPTGPTSKSEQRAQWLAQAMLLVRDHPDWSDAEIARRVGKDKSTLSRSKEYQAAAAMARGVKDDRHRGHISVDPDSGLRGVEAYSDDPAERDRDD